MEEIISKEQTGGGNGKCICKDFQPQKPLPDERQSIKRLIKALEEELDTYSDKTTDAVKKFSQELKDADKEYSGIATIVSGYKKFLEKLACKRADASNWHKELVKWCHEEVDVPTREAIKDLRATGYDRIEKKYCCQWLSLREKLSLLDNCLGQAARKVAEAKDDFDAWKGYEKALSKRFDDLKSLYDKAVALHGEEKHKSVCAIHLEFHDLYQTINVVLTWQYKRNECKNLTSDSKTCPKDEISAEQYSDELIKALRILILAKYQHFRWHQQQLELESESKKNKEACDKFREIRKDEFIQEAEDVKVQASSSQQQA